MSSPSESVTQPTEWDSEIAGLSSVELGAFEVVQLKIPDA
jgi:hypothetical protein